MSSSLPGWALKKAQLLANYNASATQESKLSTEDYQSLSKRIQLSHLLKDIQDAMKKQMEPLKKQKEDYQELLDTYLTENNSSCMALLQPIPVPFVKEMDKHGNEKKAPKDRLYLRRMVSKTVLSVTTKVIDAGFISLIGNEEEDIINISLLEKAHQNLIDTAFATLRKVQGEFETAQKKLVSQLRSQAKFQNSHLPAKKQLEIAKKVELEFLEKNKPEDDADVNAALENVKQVQENATMADVLETALQLAMREYATQTKEKIEIHASKEKSEEECGIVTPEIQHLIFQYCELIDHMNEQVILSIPQLNDKITKIENAMGEPTLGDSLSEKYKSAVTLLEQNIEQITEDLSSALDNPTEQKYALVKTEVFDDEQSESEVKEERYVVKQKEKVIKSAPAFRLTSIRPLMRTSIASVIPPTELYTSENARNLLSQRDLMKKIKEKILVDMMEAKAQNTETDTVVAIRKTAGEKRKRDE